jgi:mRNA interferase MazF
MKRGDFVTVAMQGNLGEPRPALRLQSDRLDEHATITILPVTSTIVDAPLFRITIEPNETNGLNKPSQVMVEKP